MRAQDQLPLVDPSAQTLIMRTWRFNSTSSRWCMEQNSTYIRIYLTLISFIGLFSLHRKCIAVCVSKTYEVNVVRRGRLFRHTTTFGFWKQRDFILEFSTSSFDFHLCIVIGMPSCTGLPHFAQIGPFATELRCHIQFPKWRPPHCNSTSGFAVGDFTQLARSKSTSRPC